MRLIRRRSLQIDRSACASSTVSTPAQATTTRIAPGTCAEIATGAPLPEGADAVVMVEETVRAGDDHVDITAAAAAGQNIGRRGADISPGDVAVRRGELLNPSRVGAAAAIGCVELEVFARPRVAVLSTGNEVIDPGTPLAPGQIYDVNRFTLSAVIAANGGMPEPHRPAQDTLDALLAALDGCAGADLIVFSGGSSVGERDLVVDLVAARGDDDLSRHRREARQANRLRHRRRHPVPRDAGQPDLVPVERVHPARPVSARHRPAAVVRAEDDPRTARAGPSSRPRAATSSTRSASTTAPPFPRSRAPAISRASRRRTAISKFRRVRPVRKDGGRGHAVLIGNGNWESGN